MPDGEPQVVDNPERARFEVHVDGAVAGFTEYRRTSSSVSFTHTEIGDAYEGQGLGSVLARGALDTVRAEGRRVLPHCSFIRSWIQRHPEYLDLVPAERWAQFGLTRSGEPDRA
jgi:predicted GNAT family acetyltransferase